MKIAIVFQDNDFVNTFLPLLRFLKIVWKHDEYRLSFILSDKKIACRVINYLSPIMYILFQKNYDYDKEIMDLESHKEWHENRYYLKLRENQILINDEVDNYLETQQAMFNGSTFIFDTEVRIGPDEYGYIWSV